MARDRLDGAWRPGRWFEPPTEPAAEPVALDVALVAAVAVTHVVDHEVVPWRYHVASHLTAAAAAVGGALAAGATLSDLGLRPDRMAGGARHGLAVGAIMSAGITLAALNPASRGYFMDERVLDVSPAEIAGRSLVRIPLGTAVYEEVVFRGVLLGLALRRLPPLPAVAGTSVLFGLWHVLPTLRDHGANDLTAGQPRHHAVAGAVVVTTLAGVGFAFARLRTNSVVAPIITHAVGNGVVFATAAWIGRHERRARAALRRAERPAAAAA
jgi:hypothetical protein